MFISRARDSSVNRKTTDTPDTSDTQAVLPLVSEVSGVYDKKWIKQIYVCTRDKKE